LVNCRPPSAPSKWRFFGKFVGSWDIEWHGTGPDGEPVIASGELHVGWILNARSVQDVWRMPLNDPGLATSHSGFFGSTLRFYEPVRAWQSRRSSGAGPGTR
jgi:hypothetical protein